MADLETPQGAQANGEDSTKQDTSVSGENTNKQDTPANNENSTKQDTPAKRENSKTQDEKTFRLIPAAKVAEVKRTRDGAEQRKLRLKSELDECNAIIRRKYSDVLNAKEEVVGRKQLSSEQVLGFKLKRTQIEKELAVAKLDYLKASREYRSAVTNNIQVERKSVKLIREEIRTVRESKKLARLTIEILKKHGSNGGAKEFKVLTDLAKAGDAKAFRKGFEQTMESFDSLHNTLISGVCTVKTEIIHGVMDELAKESGNSLLTNLDLNQK